MDLKKRSDVHWARKVWHITTVSAIAILYAYLPEKISLITITVSWILFVPVDFLRLKYPAVNELMIQLFGGIMRESEKNKLAGTSYLLTGVALIVYLFPHGVVLLTLFFLAFADPIASYFGILYGKDKIFGHKSIQGFMAAFFVCTIISALFFYYNALLLDRLIVVTLVAGLIGAFAELVPLFNLDDNLTLPIISAAALWGMFNIFGVA